MTSNPSVLVLGGRGRFGQAAVRAFAQAGWHVLAQVRPGATGPAVPGVRWLALAPDDTAALAAAAEGASVVVQALSPPYVHSAWRVQVPQLTDAAIRISRALGATLMLPASVYNFGAAMPRRLREDTPQAAATVKGRLRIASERQIREATLDGGMKAVVIRAGDFFGSGTGSWFDQVMAKGLAQGRFTYPGALDVPTAWAYLPDLARTFVEVAARRDRLPAFETLHFTGHTLTGQDWVAALTELAWEEGWLPAGGSLRIGTFPWPLIRLGGLVVPTWQALSEMAYLWRTPHGLANERLVALLGAEPHTPLLAAARSAADGLGLTARRGAGPAALPGQA
ncbi:NAD-dependent epimerase/dehydratase family protein [Variovorax terrae]|uniref:Sugar nucleotide-binding protein n=1 Tax=Variovorax terrae TaxID=2923278 RepID=A0A9X1W1J3_9BURK|nr:NAD-dependent epimerase/dehydratase family protein [Variovorax terrae]MCJ0766052.1 sugar nucleotide-binding protein [Variovorax terrae]